MFAVFALLSALCYGAADFLGGFTAKRASTLAVVVVSQLAGLLLLLMMLPFFPHATPGPEDLLWGALAGVTGGGGVALLYRALAIGVMAVVAPTTAVCAVVIPVFVSVWPKVAPGGCFTAHNVGSARQSGIGEFLQHLKNVRDATTRIDRSSSAGVSITCKNRVSG